MSLACCTEDGSSIACVWRTAGRGRPRRSDGPARASRAVNSVTIDTACSCCHIPGPRLRGSDRAGANASAPEARPARGREVRSEKATELHRGGDRATDRGNRGQPRGILCACQWLQNVHGTRGPFALQPTAPRALFAHSRRCVTAGSPARCRQKTETQARTGNDDRSSAGSDHHRLVIRFRL